MVLKPEDPQEKWAKFQANQFKANIMQSVMDGIARQNKDIGDLNLQNLAILGTSHVR